MSWSRDSRMSPATAVTIQESSGTFHNMLLIVYASEHVRFYWIVSGSPRCSLSFDRHLPVKPHCRKSGRAKWKQARPVSDIPTIRQVEIHLLHRNMFLKLTKPI